MLGLCNGRNSLCTQCWWMACRDVSRVKGRWFLVTLKTIERSRNTFLGTSLQCQRWIINDPAFFSQCKIFASPIFFSQAPRTLLVVLCTMNFYVIIKILLEESSNDKKTYCNIPNFDELQFIKSYNVAKNRVLCFILNMWAECRNTSVLKCTSLTRLRAY